MHSADDILSVSQAPDEHLLASVIIPAKDEETSLPHTLRALADQEGIAPQQYEVLLLVNNSTDQSLSVAQQFAQTHPHLKVHVLHKDFPAGSAHIGVIRRLLMETACHRLERLPAPARIILSTDADTQVAPDWVVQNRKAVLSGVHAVGGLIRLRTSELAQLPDRARRIRELDDRYRTLVSWLEDQCDPLPYDPWPRHYHHFGGSFAVTPKAYRKVGGLPPTPTLEDVALYEALFAADVPFRHCSDTVVYTSARMDGRTSVGLAEQLATWNESSLQPEDVPVPAVHALRERFSLRRAFREKESRLPFGAAWRQREETLDPLATEPLSSAVATLEADFFGWQTTGEALLASGDE